MVTKKMNAQAGALAAAAILGLGLATSANAGLTEFSINYYGDYAGNISYFNGSSEVTDNGVLATAFTAMRVGGDPMPAGQTDPFTTFCIDIRYVLSTSAFWQSGSLPSSNTGLGPAPFWQPNGIYRAASLYSAYSGGVGIDSGTHNAINHLEGAALQLAIWDVLYGTSGTYTVNNASDAGFHVMGYNSSVVNRANAMLASAANQVDLSLQSTFWNATLDKNGNPLAENQDLIGPPMAMAPEPSTYLGAGFAGILFLFAMRRTRTVACA